MENICDAQLLFRLVFVLQSADPDCQKWLICVYYLLS